MPRMKSLKVMTNELVEDAIKSASTSNLYLSNLVRDYFNSMTEEEIRCIYQAVSVDIPEE